MKFNLTLFLQSLVTLPMLAFAGFGLAAARRMPPGVMRAGWLLTAGMLAVTGLVKGAQDVVNVVGFAAGKDTPEWNFALAVGSMANHSRTFMQLGFYLALFALPYADRLGARAWAATVAWLGGWLALGAAYGRWEGSLDAFRHFSSTAIIDTGGFILLGLALLLLIFRDAADRLLWFAIAAFGFTSVLSALFLSVLALFDRGEWVPPAWWVHGVRLLLFTVMAALGIWRYLLARRGKMVRPMLPGAPGPARLALH